MPFLSQGGCVKDLFVTEEELIDRFTGQELWLWGEGGQLGNNINANRSSPVQTVSGGTNWKSVSAGRFFAGAIKTDGTLWMWGSNCSFPRLGDDSTINRSSPVQTISGGTNWKSVSAGCESAAAVKTDGRLWSWGLNCVGQLGDNSTIDRSSPVQTISGGTNWKSVSADGCAHSAAIKTDGTLWLWGEGDAGKLGNNSTLDRSSPVQTVSGGTNWTGASVGWSHTAAIKTDGTLWAWGRNVDGQLGTGGAVSASSPIQTISGGTNWKTVCAGRAHNISIKTDGTLWLWGCNSSGQLGDNSTAGAGARLSSPVQTISGGTNWRSVSAAGMVSSAIKTDGTLWLWGRAFRIGDNSTLDRSSPVQTISGGTNWRSVSLGYIHSGAIREDCW